MCSSKGVCLASIEDAAHPIRGCASPAKRLKRGEVAKGVVLRQQEVERCPGTDGGRRREHGGKAGQGLTVGSELRRWVAPITGNPNAKKLLGTPPLVHSLPRDAAERASDLPSREQATGLSGKSLALARASRQGIRKRIEVQRRTESSCAPKGSGHGPEIGGSRERLGEHVKTCRPRDVLDGVFGTATEGVPHEVSLVSPMWRS